MALGVDYSAWLLQDGELKRRYVYTDSKTKQHVATIYLDCKVERGALETLTFLSFMFTPFRVVDGLDLGLSLLLPALHAVRRYPSWTTAHRGMP
jgi:hypothetical protein